MSEGVKRGSNKFCFLGWPERSKWKMLVRECATAKAYDCLKNEVFRQFRVNHSYHFVDLDTGAVPIRLQVLGLPLKGT